jgi:hypothetical protein
MDAALTTATLARRCQICGYERWQLEGHEQWEHEVQIQRSGGTIIGYVDHMVHHPRVSGKGLYLRAADLAGADLFGVYEFPGWILCTERVKEFIEEQQFTNVTFLETGELIA